jgi:hypothetical protein
VYRTWNSRPISALTRSSVHRWSSAHPRTAGPASSAARSRPSCPPSSRHTAPPGPFEASAAFPPARQRRRHAYAELHETRSRRATSGTRCDQPARLVEGQRVMGWREALGELDAAYPGRLQ